jgi:RHS repeat-associated protein
MSSPEQVLVCRYRYDPLDRLTGHNLPEKPELQRFYCKSRLATEVEGTIGFSIVQHDDLLLAQQRRRSELVETALLATDLQRTVLQTVKAGQQCHSFAYSPYGHRNAENGMISLLGFNGERSDPMSGHYLLGNGHRGFNPALMRFNSPDTMSPFGKGGLNSYTYVNGDPINYVDPAGTSAFSWILRQIGKKPTYYGNGLWSRPGVTARKGRQAYKRSLQIDNEIKDIIFDSELTQFNMDYRVVNALGDTGYTPSSELQLRAYKKIRLEQDIFRDTKQIAEKFDKPYTELIKNAAMTEQQSYRPLLGKLKETPETDITVSVQLIRAAHSNKEQISIYMKRMRAAHPHEQINKLRVEKYKIRGKYLAS